MTPNSSAPYERGPDMKFTGWKLLWLALAGVGMLALSFSSGDLRQAMGLGLAVFSVAMLCFIDVAKS